MNRTDKQAERFNNYQKIAKKSLEGGNPYESLHAALAHLGISTVGQKGYQSQFGINLSKRAPIPLVGNNLLASAGTSTSETIVTSIAEEGVSSNTISVPLTELLTRVQAELDIPEGDLVMWQAEPPAQPNLPPPAIYVAAKTSASTTGSTPHKLGVCTPVFRESQDINPILDAGLYMGRYLNRDMQFDLNPDGSLRGDTRIRILQQPQHGEIEQIFPESEKSSKYEYRYIPNAMDHYDGYDKFVIEVSAAGISVKIYYSMWVAVGQPPSYIDSDGNRRDSGTDQCPRGEMWKISQNTSVTFNLASYLRDAQLQDLITTIKGSYAGLVNRGQTTFSRYHPDTLQATPFQKSPPCHAAPALPCPTFPCI